MAIGLMSAVSFSATQPAPQNFVLHDTPKPLPEVRFEDENGNARRLSDFRGKRVLLNIWATWCGPCRREMPTLDRLQATLGGPDFEVVALSIDRAGLKAVGKFYAEVGVKHLKTYVDSSGRASRTLRALGLPTTLLIGRDGREVGRLVGPAEWDTPEMVEFLRSAANAQSGMLAPAPSRHVLSTHSRTNPFLGKQTAKANRPRTSATIQSTNDHI